MSKDTQFFKSPISKQQAIELIEAYSQGGDSNNKGYFVDQAALETAYPIGENGWYAIVGTTDTVWVWDGDTSAWVNTGNAGQSYAQQVVAASAKSTPVDADLIGIVDSQAGFITKKLSWANLKATLKTYFDGLYATISNLATKANKSININTTSPLSGGGDLSEDRTLSIQDASVSQKGAVQLTNSWQSASQILAISQKALYDGLNSTSNYEALYIDPARGNDLTGDGSVSKPFASIQAAINSVAVGSPIVFYVKGSTTQDITFRTGENSKRFVFDPKTSHTGTITLVATNTSIYFDSLDGSATLSGIINDDSSGAIYYNCVVSGTYNKTGGSGSAAPSGYVEFSANSNIDSLVFNLSGNSTIRTLGTGNMGVLTQTNGIFAASHKGTMLCPILSGGANPLVGQPILLLQGQIQLLKNGGNDSLTCTATYGVVFIAGISTRQGILYTYGKINFTGSGDDCFCFVWSNSELAASGDVFPPTGAVLVNSANYLNASRTPVNYSAADSSVKSNLDGIDTALGNKINAISSPIFTFSGSNSWGFYFNAVTPNPTFLSGGYVAPSGLYASAFDPKVAQNSLTAFGITNLVGFTGATFTIPTIASLSFANLKVILGAVGGGSSAVTSLDFSSVEYIGAAWSASLGVATLDLSAVKILNGAFSPTSSPQLITLTFRDLQFGFGSMTINGAQFTNFSFGNNLKGLTGNFTSTTNTLSQASVDDILIKLAALDGTNGTIAYSGRVVTITGGASVPSAAGLTAVQTLRDRGCTVNHNV